VEAHGRAQHTAPFPAPSSHFLSHIGIRYKDLRDWAETFPDTRCLDQGVVGTEIGRSERAVDKSFVSGFKVGNKDTSPVILFGSIQHRERERERERDVRCLYQS
jgi:hypothetical protein